MVPLEYITYKGYSGEHGRHRIHEYISDVKCKDAADYASKLTRWQAQIKINGDVIKNAKDEEIITIFDSLSIKKCNLISVNLRCTIFK